MAQSIVLKRSALSGKVPDTGSLSLGEIAINTYDGRVFFKKSGSTESVEHIVTTNSITTGSITLTQTGSFGEILVTQDGNFQRDIFVTRDIVANGDIDVLGSLTASLSNGYVWVGNSSNKTTLVPTSSFGGAISADVNLLISKTGSYATTGSNVFIGNQTISGSLILTSSLTLNDTSNQILVRNTGSGIIEYASINSLLNTKNLVTVGLSGSDGAQFNSIKAAVDSITDASEYNTYTVRVGPGIFYETAIAMKSWITIKGDSTTTTIVSASNASASVFIGADQSMLIDMQIQGTTAPSQSAVVYSSPTTPQTNAIFYVENVRFGTNYTHAKVIGTSGGNCIMQCSNVKYGGYPFTLGFHATNDGSGIGRMQLRNVTSTNGGVTTTTGLVFAKADKPSCAFIVNGCLLTKAVGAAAGTGFWVENGGSLRLTSVNFQRWDKAIYAPNVGSAPSIFGSALNFENNTYDVFVEHPTITGHIEGTDTFLKSIIPADAPLYEVNTDPKRLVVAKKGGDFSSISASVAWITDSSETNRYVIEVGPGQFTENTIDLTGKPYVSIVGSNIQTTQIFPATANQHIIKMGVNNEISFLSLANAGSGYAAIYVDDVGDFAQAHKISIYDCDTGIKVLSRDNDTQFYGEYIDINGTFTYGTYVSGSNNSLCTVNVENYYLFPSGCAAIGNYVTHPSASLSLHSSTFQGDSTPNAVALQIEDGSLIEVSGLDLQDWDYGVRVPNVGIGPKFRFVGTMIHGSSTYDIEVLNTQTQGRFQGISDHTMINNLSENVYWNFLDDTDGENDVTRKLSVTFADGTHTDATTLIFKGSSMGVLEGGEITISGSLTIKTQAGYGYLHDPINPEVFKRFDWIDTNLTLSPNTNNYIYINSTGTLTSSVTIPNFAQNIILGRVVTNNTGVEFIDQIPWNAEHTANRLSKFNREALGPVFAEGSIVTENVTPFKLDVTQGNYYFSENNFLPVGTSSINLRQYYISGSGWNVTTSSIVPNNVYASGSQLIAMSASYYTKHSVYLVGDGVDEKYFLVINNNQYSSLVEAEGASLPNIPTYFNDGVVAIASVYVQSGSSNITQIQDIRPVIGFRAAGVNASAVHGNLLGLNQDDHTQYLLVNGNRSMAGNLNLGNNNITNVDSITATTINGSINATNGVVSGSSQITISATTGYSTFSSSLDSRLDNLESFTSSLDVTFVNQTELANATGSLISSIATKLNTSSFNSYTASNDSRVSSLESFTASLDVTYVNQTELATATGSLINSITTKLNTSSFETYTGSIDNKFTTLSNVTASLINATSSYETIGRGIVSGSSQITPLLPVGTVSGSSQVVGILTSLNSYTASNDTNNTTQNSRLSSLESFTSSLDVTYVNQTELANATGSLINSIATKLNTSSFNSYTSSNDNRFTNLESFTSSINTTIKNRLNAETVVSGSSQITYGNISGIPSGIVSGAVQIVPLLPVGTVSGSSQVIGILSSINSYTASNDTTNTTQNSRLTNLESTTASLNTSVLSLNTFSSSTNTRISNLEGFSSSLDVTFVNQTELANATGSLINSIATKLNTSSFNSYTASNDSRVSNLENFTSSINTTIKNRLNAETVVSGSSQITYSNISGIPSGIVSGGAQITPLLPTGTVSGSSQVIGILGSLNSYTASNDTTNTTQNGRLINLESTTASLNTSVSNLNSFTASANSRFSNLESFTASIDVTYVNQTELANATGSLINSIATKLNTSSFNSYTASNDNRVVSLENFTASINTTIKNRLNAETVVSGSSQITYSNISGIPSGIVSGAAQITPLLPVGVVSGSSQITYSNISGVSSGIVSGAAQIIPLLPTGVVSGSSQVIGILTSLNSYTASNDTTNTTQNGRLSNLELTTSSLNISVSNLNSFTSSTNTRISNLESFSSSIDVTFVNQTELANATGSLINSIGTKLNTSSFNSYTSSNDSRVSNLESFTSSINTTIKNRLNAEAVVSGSSQITYSNISGIPSGIVSGAAQIVPILPTGTVSGSSQVVGILTSLNSYTASNDTTNTTQNNRLTNLESTTASLNTSVSNLNTFSSSTNTRISNLESFSSSLDVTYVNQTELANATGSLINSIATKLNTSSFNSYTASNDGRVSNLENFTSSINTTIKNRLNAETVVSGSSQITYSNISGIPSGIVSGATQIIPLLPTGTVSGSSQITYSNISGIPSGIVSGAVQIVPLLPTGTVSGSSQVIGILTSLNSYTSSNDTTNTTQNGRLTNLESTTASINVSVSNLNTFTASANSRFSNLESFTASIDNTYVNQTELANATGSLINSIATKLNTSSFQTYTSSVDSKFTSLESATASLIVETANLEVFSASTLTRLSNIESFSSSQNSKNITLATYTGSIDTKFTTLSSSTASLNTFTSSIDAKFTTLANTTASLISKTGSYASTGSNTFYGTQVMSGSVYVTGDLVVIGSSSISNISASSLSIGDNQIVLNTFTPAIRYGGISVIDSGSNGTTGSLWWDSVNNHWLYEHPGDSPATYNSAILIAGPTNTGSLGQEVGLTSNRLTVATGTDHISSSQIYVDNTTVSIPANLQVTGSFDLRNAEFNATASNSSAGNVLVSTNPTASYNSAFYNYSITSGSNARAGQIMSIWNGNTLRYTEVTTTDIGNTSTAVFSASLSGGNILLHLSSSGVWNVRSIVNLL